MHLNNNGCTVSLCCNGSSIRRSRRVHHVEFTVVLQKYRWYATDSQNAEYISQSALYARAGLADLDHFREQMWRQDVSQGIWKEGSTWKNVHKCVLH